MHVVEVKVNYGELAGYECLHSCRFIGLAILYPLGALF